MKFSLEPIDENALYLTVGTVVTEELWIAIAKKFEAIQRVRELADNFNLPENKDRTFAGEFVYLAIQDTLDSEQ